MAKMKDTEIRVLNEQLDDMVKRGLEQQRQFHDMWRDGLNYIFDNQLEGKTRRRGWERISVNYVWPAVIQEVALLSQQQPKIVCLPGSKDQSDIDAVSVWDGALQWQWDKVLGMNIKRIEALLDTQIFGNAIYKTYYEQKHKWNPEKLDWDGKCISQVVYPPYFGCDPDAESPEDWEYCFTRRNVRLGWAKQRWPELAKDLEAESDKQTEKPSLSGKYDESWYMNLANVDRGIDTEGRITSILANARQSPYRPIGDDKKPQNANNRVIAIEEIYFRDYETSQIDLREPIPVEDLTQDGLAVRRQDGLYENPQTKELWTHEKWPMRDTRSVQAPVYPNGRFVLRVGDLLLNADTAEQQWKSSRWPFVVQPNYLLPHIAQGLNGVEMSRPLQNWLNVCTAHMTNYIKYFSDPIRIVEENVLVKTPRNDKPRMWNAAGSIIQVIQGAINKIRDVPPQAMPTGVFTFYNLMAQEIRNQTGMQEVIQGIGGKKEMTAAENTRLNTNSRLRVAMKSIFQEAALKKIAEQLAELDQMYWSVGDWIRVVGSNNQKGIEQITQQIKNANFDVDIEIGTALPFDQEKRKADYMQAAQMIANPAYTPMLEELLTELDIANKDEILQRVQSWQQLQQYQSILPYIPKMMQLPQVQQMFTQMQQQQGQQPQQQPQGPGAGNASRVR